MDLKSKAFLKAREEWKERADANRRNCALVGFWNEKSGLTVAGNTACHASLSYPPIKGATVLFSNWMSDYNTAQGVHDNEELLQTYFHWFKEGGAVWGEGLLSETWEDVRDYGWMFRTDLPHNLLCGALTATRVITEFRPKARTFKYFYDKGYTGEEAYIIANQFEYRDTKSKPYMTPASASGHLPVDGSWKGTLGYNFYNKTPRREGKNYVEANNYSGFTCEWEVPIKGKGKIGVIETFARSLKPEEVAVVEDTKDIFNDVLWEARERADRYGYEGAKFTKGAIDTMGERMKKWMKENYA